VKKGLDENFKKNPLRVYFIHSISECANPFSLLPKKGIKDLLDPPSNPCTTMNRVTTKSAALNVHCVTSPQSQCFVLFSFSNFIYQMGCRVAAISAQRPVERVKNALQNITSEGMKQSVVILSDSPAVS